MTYRWIQRLHAEHSIELRPVPVPHAPHGKTWRCRRSLCLNSMTTIQLNVDLMVPYIYLAWAISDHSNALLWSHVTRYNTYWVDINIDGRRLWLRDAVLEVTTRQFSPFSPTRRHSVRCAARRLCLRGAIMKVTTRQFHSVFRTVNSALFHVFVNYVTTCWAVIITRIIIISI